MTNPHLEYLEKLARDTTDYRTTQRYESTHRNCWIGNGHYEDCGGYPDMSKPIPIKPPSAYEQALWYAVAEIKALTQRVYDLEAQYDDFDYNNLTYWE